MRTIAVDRYLVETLMRDLVSHDKRPSAFIVYLQLWLRTHGDGHRTIHQSHQQLADATGLSKSAVQIAIKVLLRRKLLDSTKKNPTSTPQYTVLRPWLD